MISRGTIIVMLCVVSVVAGCMPSITPLYRDYADSAPSEERSSGGQLDRVRRALDRAGWTPVDGVAGQTVMTESRIFRNWGLYRVEVELEAIPLAGDHVRILIHPYRRYFSGRRSRIPYLKSGLAGNVLEELSTALDSEGLTYEGTAQQRDRAAIR